MTDVKVLRGGRVAHAGALVPCDLVIEGHTIARLGSDLPPPEGAEVFSIDGLAVLPGLIDTHVHFRDPGATHKEDWASGSRGAARGGVTTVLDIQNNEPLSDTIDRLREKARIAREKSIVNFGLYANVTPENLEHLPAIARYCVAFKVFLARSVGPLPGLDRGHAEEAFRRIAPTGRPLVVHAEDEEIHAAARGRLAAPDIRHHHLLRPEVSERVAVATALELAAAHGTELHLCHLSSGASIELIRRARSRGVRVTCGTCPHYLYLTATDVARLGHAAKVNPSLKTEEDRQFLWESLASGDLDLVATDHAPHTAEEKARSYAEAPSGIVSIDLFLPLLVTAVREGQWTLDRMIDAACRAPARAFHLVNKGAIQPGFDADLVVVDLERRKVVGESDIASKQKLSPFAGRELWGWPVLTLVGGRVAFDGEDVRDDCRGRPVSSQ